MAVRSLRAGARLSVGAARQGRCVGAGPVRPRAGGGERSGAGRGGGAGLGPARRAAGLGLSCPVLSCPVLSCWVSREPDCPPGWAVRGARRLRARQAALPAGQLPGRRRSVRGERPFVPGRRSSALCV